VIDWLGNPRTAIWTALTGARTRVGYDLPRRRWAYNVKVPRNKTNGQDVRAYAGEAFIDPLRCLGLNPEPWSDGIARQVDRLAPAENLPSAELVAWTDRWLKRDGVPVVVVVSATWPAKKWPVIHIRELLQQLPAVGANPVLITGPGDEWLVSGLDISLGDDLVAPPTNLPELAYIVGQARLFIGTDCGPRHLAAALGVPTVTIFGPTDPGGWNPPTPRHVSVRHQVPCAPCNLTICPVAGHPCLEDLKSDVVIAAVARQLKRI